jgi:tricorn protease-like protein
MTRRRLLERLLCLLLALAVSAAAGEARFMTLPDVRGERLVFAYEGDLYLAGVEGGPPVRLTSHPASSRPSSGSRRAR